MMDSDNLNQTITGDNAVALQVSGDGNTLIIDAAGTTLFLDRPHSRRAATPPANERQLLLTERRSTDLVGREKELSWLAQWLSGPPSVSVRCVTGRAGAGKTRLAIEACERAEAQGWVAGFVAGDELRRFQSTQGFARWRSSQDTLIVVDEAAASASILKKWFAALAPRLSSADGPKLRILLLERHADPESDHGWWAELVRPESLARAGAVDLIAGELPLSLSVIGSSEERRTLLTEAMRLASGFLNKPALAPPQPGTDAEFDRRLADNRLENEPLFLLMAGIVAAARGVPAALALGRIDLAKEVAAMERARLARFGADRGLDADGALISHLAACMTLQRGCNLSEAEDLVREELEALGFSGGIQPEAIVEIIAEALPAAAADEIDRVRPDLIGEAFFVREFIGGKARPDRVHFSIVQRAHARRPESVRESLVLAAQDLASGAADHVTVRWLTDIALRSNQIEELCRISDTLPEQSLALCELGVLVSERIVALARAKTGTSPSSLLGTALNNLAIRLHALSRLEEALAAAEESVALRRQLADEHPQASKVELAVSINTLANQFSALGRRDDALGAALESVELLRALALEQAARFTPSLAVTLNNLSSFLGDVGDRHGAVAAAKEAVALFRQLTEEQPERYSAHLAGGLNNLSNCWRAVGQPENALEANGQSVEIYRKLSAANPDAFSADLAMALNNQAVQLSALGERTAALAAAEEALDIYRTLANARPEAFSADLAGSLNTLANRLSDLGRHEEALEATRESVERRRRLTAERPDAFTPELAGTLNNLAVRYASLGQFEEALEAAREATELSRALTAARPAAFEPHLAMSLNNLASYLGLNDRGDEALAAAGEAVDLYRKLSVSQPDAFASDLAGAMNNLANRLLRLGRVDAALQSAQEAVDLYRQLAKQRPQAFAADFAVSLSVMADILVGAGRLAEAVACDREAVKALLPDFEAQPAVFAPRMARLISDYLEHAEAASIDVDRPLIESAAKVFSAL